MNPMLIVGIPLALVIVGMVLNSFDLGFNQPPSSGEQDPAKRAAAEGEAYRRFFDLQRRQAVTRQPVCLVTYGRHYRFLRLAVYVYREQNHRHGSNCRASDTGNGRREGDGSLGHAEGREQCQIPDQISQTRQHGCRHKRINCQREGLILGDGTIRYGLEYRYESIDSRRCT